ncbi:MlaD family protein [Breoghania sp. L-A4]|uniref:MlaD family protein n=1 Tax=Breoghania sp. L-A4 TaxID=2304600 RepID=UPI000E359CE0|nr:MlaD family protein [Breoghania sp. L-A4]AXS41246.1 MCE family protein [Breoghania sp. L-A4]
METRANYIAIGSFALLTLVTTFLFVGWLSTQDNGKQIREVRVVFPGSVTGLAVGGLVYFNGIKVGQVRDLMFDQNDPTKVIAVAAIDGESPLRSDTRATLGFSALTGVAYVELAGGSPDLPLLFSQAGVPTLQAERSAFQDLVDGARQILGKADQTLTSVNSLVEDNRKGVSDTVGNVKRFSEALASNSEGVEKFMAGVSDATDAFTSLSGRLETLVVTGESVVAAVDPEKVARVVENVANASDQLGRAVAGIDAVVETAKTTMGELENFGSGLNETLARVNALVASVDPARIESIVGNVDDVSGKIAEQGENLAAVMADARAAAKSIRSMSEAVETRTQTITRFIDDAGRLGEDMTALSGRLNSTLTSVDGIVKAVDPDKVANVLASIDTVTEGIAGETGAIREAIADARRAAGNVSDFTADLKSKQPDIDQIVADAKQLSGRLNEASTRIDGILAKVDGFVDGDGKGFIAEATEAARSIRVIAQAFEGRAGPIADGFARFSGRGLRDLQAMIEQGRRTLEQFERAVSGFERNPSRVIFGGDDVPVYDGARRR